LANEVIDGKPLEDVDDRDVRGTLISLSVIRSESTAGGHHDRAEQISGIIRQLNFRVQPPAAPRLGSVFGMSSAPEGASTAKYEPSPTQRRARLRELPDEQYDEVLLQVNKLLSQKVIDIDDENNRAELVFVIDSEVKKSVGEHDYDRVQQLHALGDKVRKISNPQLSEDAFRRDHIKESIAKLQAEEAEIVRQIKDIERENAERLKTEIEKKQAEFEAALEDLRNPKAENSEKDDAKLGPKWSAILLALRDDEERFAAARDYEAARIAHQRAEEREQFEKDAQKRIQQRRVDRLVNQKKAEQERNLQGIRENLILEGRLKTRDDEARLQKVRRSIRSAQIDLVALRKSR
jgi:hypothetical protein